MSRHVVVCDGNTYPARAILRKDGFKWGRIRKIWVLKEDLDEETIQRYQESLRQQGFEVRVRRVRRGFD